VPVDPVERKLAAIFAEARRGCLARSPPFCLAFTPNSWCKHPYFSTHVMISIVPDKVRVSLIVHHLGSTALGGLKMFVTLMKLWKSEDGATAIEYGLIAALIAVAAISAMQLVGTSLTSTFNNIASKL